ncbi:hypothetical protein AAGW05_09920 [Arthrobacter sp. LAPM80]|uniref:hypothetical protein n=1 Tax=Arthrobacter sp. LAPM80 TaxID=3141788 RepID=UPI00398B4018
MTFEQRISQAAAVPCLSMAQYRRIFLSLAVRSHSSSNAGELAKLVRDDCVAGGTPAPRAKISLVVRGLKIAGNPLDGQSPATTLAAVWVKHVQESCHSAGVVLEERETKELQQWVSGGLWGSGPAKKLAIA